MANESTYETPDLRPLQEVVDRWIRTTGVRYFDPMTNMAILAEETGEVARIMARRYGEQSFKAGEEAKANLGDELADVVWVVAAIANQCGVDLTDAMQRNIAKKTSRDATRHATNPKLQQLSTYNPKDNNNIKDTTL